MENYSWPRSSPSHRPVVSSGCVTSKVELEIESGEGVVELVSEEDSEEAGNTNPLHHLGAGVLAGRSSSWARDRTDTVL